LELTPAEAELPMTVQRGDQTLHPTLKLSGKWRRTTDPSWRESLHIAGPGGGFWGEKVTEEERTKLGLPAGRMAVRVTFIWGDHARKAGLKQQDIVVEFDGLKTDMTIGQLHAHLNLNRNYGDTIAVSVRRGTELQKLALDLPKGE
jgi:S1-C subfamily serine protease